MYLQSKLGFFASLCELRRKRKGFFPTASARIGTPFSFLMRRKNISVRFSINDHLRPVYYSSTEHTHFFISILLLPAIWHGSTRPTNTSTSTHIRLALFTAFFKAYSKFTRHAGDSVIAVMEQNDIFLDTPKKLAPPRSSIQLSLHLFGCCLSVKGAAGSFYFDSRRHIIRAHSRLHGHLEFSSPNNCHAESRSNFL